MSTEQRLMKYYFKKITKLQSKAETQMSNLNILTMSYMHEYCDESLSG
jgi:hypothetical protein